MGKSTEKQRHYFVDEAGDLTLFNRRGEIIIGTPGCSNYFILATALVEEPHNLRKKIEELRSSVLLDSYLSKIPSIKKTALAFHAKDDCPEVRHEFYKLIANIPVKIYAIVRRKKHVVRWVHNQNSFDQNWRYSADKIYDSCVKRLFKDRLHIATENYITFARRGKSIRNTALLQALNKAVENFEKKSGREISTMLNVISNYPSNEPCLQIADYALWALQRLYERHEERYFDYIRNKFIRIIDLDDKREKDYGVYYDERNQLTADKIKNSLLG